MPPPLTGSLRYLLLLCLTAGLTALPSSACASAAAMKAPGGRSVPAPSPVVDDPGSQPLLGAIRFFQEYISPADGARCRFHPTCSAFGHQAIDRHGPGLGLLMTTDRLMRCSYWTDPADYPRRPDGRLVDPVAARPVSD